MTNKETTDHESFKVSGDEILSKVKEIIKQGNSRTPVTLFKTNKQLKSPDGPNILGSRFRGVIVHPAGGKDNAIRLGTTVL
jgi:hypothetical protein